MLPDRLAKCGHLAPYVSGPQKRLCPACAAPKARVCGRCATDITHRHPTAKYCSERCYRIVAGQRLALPMALRVCALQECTTVFQPRADRERCCKRQHGVRLANREARARAQAENVVAGVELASEGGPRG